MRFPAHDRPRRFLLVVCMAALAPGASAQAPAPAGTRDAAAFPAIHRFAEPGPGSVNTYWIDAPQGLVVVDFQRDTVAASAAIERIKAHGRPVAALLLTHPHPDHIGGLDQFKRAFPDAPLHASRASADEINADARGYQRMTRGMLGGRAPASFPGPDRIVESGAPLRIGGLDIEPLELGPGEAVAATAYHLPASGALFGGDVAVGGMTDFLLEGRTGAWLEQIERLREAFPAAKTLYPGHGSPGQPAEMMDEAAGVLRFYRAQATAAVERGEVEGGPHAGRREGRRGRGQAALRRAHAGRARAEPRRGEREGGGRRDARRAREAVTRGHARPPKRQADPALTLPRQLARAGRRRRDRA